MKSADVSAEEAQTAPDRGAVPDRGVEHQVTLGYGHTKAARRLHAPQHDLSDHEQARALTHRQTPRARTQS
ncbi:hypothetical protein AA983_14005 [Dermacoccus sp. PE3]|uniref:hypothetical protein n=1 Tax=Dermacoccus sp. PE3 TaxID=1641401 RepID=UPI00064256A4|nr:hypothetical protein [Dermacoccus sp. PE3]KLO61770.1 hypothetical protein AA983_14005 [Dermacoccus sp. PE3]